MSWFKNWFNELYPVVYAARTKAEAKSEVDFIAAQLPGISNFSCLDVGCGDGRHLAALGGHTARCTGVDLSTDLLTLAKKEAALTPNSSVVRADFRELPFINHSFDLLTSLFTGFGYLDSDAEHLQLLQEWRRVLTQNGHFVLDFLDRDFVLSNIVPLSERETCGFRVTERRYLSSDQLRIEKDLTIEQLSSGELHHFKESVRAYTHTELTHLLTSAGFAVGACFSDYQGTPYNSGIGRLVVFSEPVN